MAMIIIIFRSTDIIPKIIYEVQHYKCTIAIPY